MQEIDAALRMGRSRKDEALVVAQRLEPRGDVGGVIEHSLDEPLTKLRTAIGPKAAKEVVSQDPVGHANGRIHGAFPVNAVARRIGGEEIQHLIAEFAEVALGAACDTADTRGFTGEEQLDTPLSRGKPLQQSLATQRQTRNKFRGAPIAALPLPEGINDLPISDLTPDPVSYSLLTLPTIYSVFISLFFFFFLIFFLSFFFFFFFLFPVFISSTARAQRFPAFD